MLKRFSYWIWGTALLSMALLACLSVSASAEGPDFGEFHWIGAVVLTERGGPQVPASSDGGRAGPAGVASGEKASPSPSKTPSEEFQKVCMAYCKGPLFRCSQFCAMFNK